MALYLALGASRPAAQGTPATPADPAAQVRLESLVEDSTPAGSSSVQEQTQTEALPKPALEGDSVKPPNADIAREIGDALRAIESDEPDLARRETLGHTVEGREIPLIILSDLTVPGAKTRPAILFIEESGRSAQGARALTQLARRILERAKEQESVRRALQEMSVLIAPLPDPDALVAAIPSVDGMQGEGIHLARNFPLGWRPERLLRGGGETPLSKPATMAFAELLALEHRLLYAVGLSPYRQGKPYPGAEAKPADLASYAFLGRELKALSGGKRLIPWPQLASKGGSFLDYAYQGFGVYGLGLQIDEALSVSESAEEVLQLLEGLTRTLPKLELKVLEPRRIGPSMWQLDVEIANRSELPTLSAIGRERSLAGEIQLRLKGALIVASASARWSATDQRAKPIYRETAFHTENAEPFVELGTLLGGEAMHVRLIVRGETEEALELSVRALRAVDATLKVHLLESGKGD